MEEEVILTLEPMMLASESLPVQGGPNDRKQPFRTVFVYTVGGAALDALDRMILSWESERTMNSVWGRIFWTRSMATSECSPPKW